MTDEQLTRLTDAILALREDLKGITMAIESSNAGGLSSLALQNSTSGGISTSGVVPKNLIKVAAPKRRTATKTTLTSRGKKYPPQAGSQEKTGEHHG